MIKKMLDFLLSAYRTLLENMNMAKTQPCLTNSVTDKRSPKKNLWRRRDGADPYYLELVATRDNQVDVREPGGAVYQMDANHFPLEYEKAF